MNIRLHNHKTLLLGALVLLMSGALPYSSQAAGIGFRNETTSPVIVQGSSIIGGMVQRGKPVLILPARIGSDENVPNGLRQITIYHPKQPSRILYRGSIPFNGVNQFFKIRTNPRPAPYPLMLVR